MKKIYVLFALLLLNYGAFAQISSYQEIIPIDKSLIPQRTGNANGSRAGQQLWLEYDSADAYNFSTNQVRTIQWIMNKRYTLANAPNSWQFCMVKFDTLYDINTMTDFPKSNLNDMTIDSIYAIIGHQNNSGENDTFIVKILDLNAARYPTSTVLWTDTFITNTSLSPSQDWRRPVRLSFSPNFSSTSINGFAVELDFYGSLQDTCAFLVGFNNLGAAPSPYQLVCPYRANISNFYPNSYAAWTNYAALGYPMFPMPDGTDVTQDCNGNLQFDEGIDGYNFIQDILIGAYVTVNKFTACSADFTIAADTTQPLTYDATNLSVGNGEITYDWSWGDGTTNDTIANPSHTYADTGYYDICLTITDSIGCSITFCDSAFHVMFVGMNELNSKNFNVRIYPKPAQNNLVISSPDFQFKNIEIYSLIGEKVYSGPRESGKNGAEATIDISSLSPGLYFLQLSDEKSKWTGKFLKQ